MERLNSLSLVPMLLFDIRFPRGRREKVAGFLPTLHHRLLPLGTLEGTDTIGHAAARCVHCDGNSV